MTKNNKPRGGVAFKQLDTIFMNNICVWVKSNLDKKIGLVKSKSLSSWMFKLQINSYFCFTLYYIKCITQFQSWSRKQCQNIWCRWLRFFGMERCNPFRPLWCIQQGYLISNEIAIICLIYLLGTRWCSIVHFLQKCAYNEHFYTEFKKNI
jgi:hypothetical protein